MSSDVISVEKQQQIELLLQDIEQKNKIQILWAAESGSRAWGFPSQDSDYDIRFIYCHPKDWYVTAFQKRDLIDLVLIFDLDAGGWDIGKCLRLLYRSNASVFEWLNSPIVYRQQTQRIQPLQALAQQVFNPKAVYYHYLSMAKKKLLEPNTFHNGKAFLYCLRALLCAQWVLEEKAPPPVLFDELAQRYLQPEELYQPLQELLAEKRLAGEKDHLLVPTLLSEFAESRYHWLTEQKAHAKREGDSQKYDEVLLQIVDSNWS